MLFIILASFLHFSLGSDSIESGWKNMIPLKTSKIEAEKILGKPTYIGKPEVRGTGHYEYETEDATVQINYSTEPCKKNYGGRGDYSVPKDTVLGYIVVPKKSIKLSDFKYSREKYEKIENKGEYTDYFYENADDGIIFSTKVKDNVEYLYHISFDPRIKNIGYRECTSRINFKIEDGWEGIKTLQTNKNEVENILGKPSDSSDNYASEYKTEEAWVRIKYSSEPCRKNEDNRGGYNVPKDTVLEYSILLNKALKLADFKYNRQKFVQSPETKTYYENADDGIFFITIKRDGSEYISSITFKPGIKNSRNLKCKIKE